MSSTRQLVAIRNPRPWIRARGARAAMHLRRALVQLLTLGVLVVLPAASASAVVTINGTPTLNESSADRSSATFAHTVAAGLNRVLIVMIHIGPDGISATDVEYGGLDLTLAVSRDGADGADGETHTELWYLVSPPVGTANVVVTYSATTRSDGIAALTYNGVDQASPIGATNSATAATGTDATVSITTTVANSLIVGGVTGHGSDTQPATPGMNTFERYDEDTGGSTTTDNSYVGGDETTTTPGSFTFNWTMLASDYWTIVAAELKPAVGPLAGLFCDADIVVILDRTGSMTAPDLVNESVAAKTLLTFFAEAMVPPFVSIGAFGDDTNDTADDDTMFEAFIEPGSNLTRTLSPAPYGDNHGDNDNDLYDGVEDVTATNSAVGTNIRDALHVANLELNNGTSVNRAILIISDGDANEPPFNQSNDLTAREAAYDESDIIKGLGRQIFAIHFGADPAGFAGPEMMAAIVTGTVAPPATDGHNTHGHLNGADVNAGENTDGDNLFIAPTASDMTLILQVIALQFCQSLPTPTPTNTPTNTPTRTNTPTNTPTSTPTRTNTPTPTPTRTNTPTPTPTNTNTPTPTPTRTNTPTPTPTNTNTPTPTPTRTNTPTPTPTNTNTRPRRRRGPTLQPRRRRTPTLQPRRRRTPTPQPRRRRGPTLQPRRRRTPTPRPRRRRGPTPQPRRRRIPTPQPRRRRLPQHRPSRRPPRLL